MKSDSQGFRLGVGELADPEPVGREVRLRRGSEPRNPREFTMKSAKAVALALAIGIAGCEAPLSTVPIVNDEIEAETKHLSQIAADDVLERILPAIEQREVASALSAGLLELQRLIHSDRRRHARGMVPLVRAHVDRGSSSAPATSDDPIHLTVVSLYLDFVDRQLSVTTAVSR